MAIKKDQNLESFLALASRYLTSRQLGYEILLFGSKVKDSAVNKSYQVVSDTDLLVIVDAKDLVKDEWKQLTCFFEALDETCFKRRSDFPAFLNSLNRLTGMFRNVFVARLDSLEKKEFTSLFSVSKTASFLIPAEKVIQNVLNNHVHLSGQHYVADRSLTTYRNTKRKEQELNSWLRSLLLNLLLSLGSLIILPFSSDSTLYAMEAVKWSLLNTEFSPLGQEMKTTNDILLAKILEKKGLKKRLFYRLLFLRRNYKQDPTFNFSAPFLVLTIHIDALKSSRNFSASDY